MKITRKFRTDRPLRTRGFSLMEMMIVIAIMFIVFAVVFESANMFQQRGFAEVEKVDSVQSARDFVDAVSRDIHDAGYPPATITPQGFGTPTCVGNPNVACGIVWYTPLKIQYEGDLDGTGTVYTVTLELVAGPNGTCPCLLRRGVIQKSLALNNTPPTYYTEVNGVLNSGNWAGSATYPVSLPGSGSYSSYGTSDVFAGYANDGTQITATCQPPSPCGTQTMTIRELRVTANVAPNFADPQLHTFPVFSITSKARLSNVSP